MSRLALALAAFLLFASVPAVAAQGLPEPVEGDGLVSSWSAFGSSRSCTSLDPVVGVVDLGLGSSVETAPAEDGTRYAFHLTSAAPREGCPAAMDLEFVSSLAAWPTTPNAWENGDVRSACGATGSIGVYPSADGRLVRLSLDLPEACAVGMVGHVDFWISMRPLHPSEYMLCQPLVLATCVGAYEADDPYATCASGRPAGGTYVAPVVSASRDCWEGERVWVSLLFGFVYVEGEEAACTLHLFDVTSGVYIETPCPAEVGAALYGVEWGRVLP